MIGLMALSARAEDLKRPPANEVPPLSGNFVRDVEFPEGGRNHRTFRVEVTDDVKSLELTLRGADTDVDLYVRHGAEMDSWDQADAKSNGDGADETIRLTRDGEPALRSGIWFVDISRPGDEAVTMQFGGEINDSGGVVMEAPVPDDVETVIRGKDTQLTAEFVKGGADYLTYLIEVPAGAESLLVTARGAKSDLDLYLRYGKSIENYKTDPDFSALSNAANEHLYVDLSSTPRLRPGRYFLDVVRVDSDADLGPVELSILFDADPPPASDGPVTALEVGQRQRVSFLRSEHKAARFLVEVPEGAESLHIAVFGSTRDVDFFVRRDKIITSYDDDSGYDWSSVTVHLNERMVIDKSSTPRLRPGTYHLDVASLVEDDEYVDFTIIATLDAPPAVEAGDVRFPPYEASGDPPTVLEIALAATVEVNSENGGGSGTCVTPTGLIISNHHVFEDEGELQTENILVSFPEAWDQPPNQVFIARIVFHNKELDLVLLELVSDIYERPLPEGLKLPFLPFGDSGKLRLGETLLVAGYPMVGGDESRLSLSLTQGIVTGFQSDRGRRTWIKTDARINAGNSGGTLLAMADGRWTYVGVPSREISADGDTLGYCRPTSLIPDEWMARIRAELEAP